MSAAPTHRRDPRAPAGRHSARPHGPSPLANQLGAASAVTALALGGAAVLGGASTALPAFADQAPSSTQPAAVVVHPDTTAAVPAATSVAEVTPPPAAVVLPVAPKATTVAAPTEKRTPQPSRQTRKRAGTPKPATDTAALRTGGRHARQAARTVAPQPLAGCPSPDVTADLANGQIPDTDLCLVPGTGQRLRSDAAAAWFALAAAYAKEFGHMPRITDSYRSLEVQQELIKRKPTLAAKPGTSNHGLGIAVDLGDGIERVDTVQHTWMLTNAPRFGWTNPAWAQPGGSKLEPWHWEYAAPVS